jgi:AAA domain
MAFKKAVSGQAKFKAGFYGKQGSGKTFTALLVAEGLAKRDGKRVAFVDTERGTDFYSKAIKERRIHPAEFDFDAIYTREIYEVIKEVKAIDTGTHGVVVIDSITHLWEAAKAPFEAKYGGRKIPAHQWGAIKKPYKQLMSLLLDGNYHVIICGREGIEFGSDEDGDMIALGTKMKAEGETAYEPHLLARFCPERKDDGGYLVRAFFEKDRSGILTGKTIAEPNYDTFAPIMRYLSGDTQAAIGDADAAAERDAAAAEREMEAAAAERNALFESIRDAITSATRPESLRVAWSLVTGKKTKLGEENMDKLTALKDSRKAELAAAMVEVA